MGEGGTARGDEWEFGIRKTNGKWARAWIYDFFKTNIKNQVFSCPILPPSFAASRSIHGNLDPVRNSFDKFT